MRFLECLKSAGKIHDNNDLWSMMKKSSVSGMQKVYVFSDSVLCRGKVNQNPTSNIVWEEQLSWFKDSSHYRTLDTIDGEPMEWEWNISPRFTTLQLISKVQEFMTKMGDPSQIKGRIIFRSMFNDLSWGYKDNETECIANSTLVSLSFLGLGSEISGILLVWQTQVDWARVAELMMIKFRESRHPVFRATSPSFPRNAQKATEVEKLSRHFCADGDTIETVFRTFIYVYELIFGAVSDLCDEYSACQARTVRPVLAGRSDPLFEPARLLMTTPTPSIEVLARKFIAKVQRASGKALTTGPSDQNLY